MFRRSRVQAPDIERVQKRRWRPVRWPLILASGLLGLGCGAPQPPNVILISVDTLRADHLGCYGYLRRTSPHIDAFARDAVVFENAVAHGSMTSTTVASILSGFLPHEMQVIDARRMPTEIETLPELLGAHGYTTIAVVSNYVLGGEGYSQGFSIYDHTMLGREQNRAFPERIAVDTTDRAIELLAEHEGGPLFMWVHYQDPHVTYTPPDRFAKTFRDAAPAPRLLPANKTWSGRGGIPRHQRLGRNRDYHHYVAQYDGEIRYTDEHFGRLIDAIKGRDLYDDSLIIFTADHGENMGEHDYFFNHGENLYHGVTHVPLIIRFGGGSTGRRAEFVQHVDIVPTVMKAVGLDFGLPFRGSDLLEQPLAPREIFAESRVLYTTERRMFFVIRDGLKLIHRPSVDRYHLFDLNVDPEEKLDLVHDERYREQVAELRGILARIRSEDRLDLGNVPRASEPTAEEREKLKSLGYVE